jgi:phospholipid/cholesterol/gamma-HCH transport system permease protein
MYWFRSFPLKAGQLAISFIEQLGEVALLITETFRCFFSRPLRLRQTIQQIYFVGVRSQVVVLTTGIFTGAVFAAQIQFQFHRLGMDSATGSVATLAMCRELGPVLSALMIAGRVGSAMAAELATMKISEQIDALRALAVYPIEYLIVPRFVAMMISLPVLVAMAIAGGMAAGYVVAVPLLGVDGTYYWYNILQFTEARDMWIGLIKAFLFSIIIVSVSCHKGLMSGTGAESVGRATTEAAVSSSLSVLIANFFFTFMLNSLFPVS